MIIMEGDQLVNDVSHVGEDVRALESDEGDIESNEPDSASDYSEEGISNKNDVLNMGWVDSISKILKTRKPKGKKTIVLSKAKKLTDIKREQPKPVGYEVETIDGKIKEEKTNDTIDDLPSNEPPCKKKRELPTVRIKPNILEKDRERTLQKIATKGVVQLFNAVKMQQKEISDRLKDAGPLEAKKEKVMKNLDKRTFLDVLMGEKSQKVDDVPIQKIEQIEKKETQKDTTWSVLKDDFMMTAKMKDWDKDLNVDEEDSVE